MQGLFITAGNSTVRGLVINRFGMHGIVLQTNGGNTVTGNYIGTDAAGTARLGNVIAGNRRDGVWLVDTHATGNVVPGNFIGTDVTGSQPLGNGG